MADPKIKYDIEANVSGNAEVRQLASRIEQLAATLDGELKTSALASADALRQLAQKDGAIRNFVDLKREAGQAATGLSEAQAAAQKLGAELASIATPTRAQAGQLQKLRDAVRDAKTEVVAKNAALTASRGALSQYGISTDNLSQSQRNVKAAIAAAKTEVQAMAPAWQSAAAGASASAGKQVQSAKQIESGLDSLKGQLNSLRNIAVAALGGSYVGSLAKDVAATADAYNNLQARIKLVTGEGAAFETAFEGVSAVAQRTSSNLEETGKLFTKLADAGRAMGVGQAEALALTETVNQAVQLSGASTESAKAGLTQLIQGFQSGILRGDEFNSVMENSPRLAKALADGLGVTTGELRKMAEAGQLSSETVIKALQGQSDAVAAEFAKLPPTVGRAIQNLSTSWTLYVGEADKATGASTGAASAINALATNLDSVARVAAIAGAALTASLAVQGAAALRAYAVEAALAAGATNLLTASIDKVPKTVNIVVAATGFEVGWQIGTMLRENSAWARQLGVAMVGYFAVVVNSLRLAKEAAAAVFTSDTVGAAHDRFMERNKQVRDQIKDMMDDAEKAPGKVGAAVDGASGKVQGLGSTAQATGAQVAQAGAAGAAGMVATGKAAADTLAIFKALLAEAQKEPPKQGALEGLSEQLVEARKKGLDLDGLLRRDLGDKVADGLLDQAKAKADELKVSLDKAKPGVDGLREAMKQLGVVSDETLKNTASQSKKAFDEMRNSGTASARELSEGFKKYAADAIAANGGVATEALKAEAKMYDMEIQVDKTGKAIVRAMGDAAKATGEVTLSARELVEEYRRVAGAAYEATSEIGKAQMARRNAAVDDGQFLVAGEATRDAQRADNMDKNEKSRADRRERNNAPVSTMTTRGVFEMAKGQGLTDAQSLQIMNQFMQNGRPVNTGGGMIGRLDGSNWGTDLQKAIDALVLQNAAGSPPDLKRIVTPYGVFAPVPVIASETTTTSPLLIFNLRRSKPPAWASRQSARRPTWTQGCSVVGWHHDEALFQLDLIPPHPEQLTRAHGCFKSHADQQSPALRVLKRYVKQGQVQFDSYWRRHC